MRWPFRNISEGTRRRIFLCLTLVVLAFTVRYLTAQFIKEHITDAAWFPYGIYAIFDNQAQDVMDGKARAFWVEDALSSPRAATAAVYPPGYSLWLAFVYKLSGERSALVVQSVQFTLDSFFVLLIVGAGVTAYGWRASFTTG